MNNLLIVYSNLGLGGVPKKIISIVRQYAILAPSNSILLLLQKRSVFSYALPANIGLTVQYHESSGAHRSFFSFIVQIFRVMLYNKPPVVLTFISSYALPVILCRLLLFWRPIKIIVGEDHMTSTMTGTMKFPWAQRLGVRLLYRYATIILVPARAIKYDLIEHSSVPKEKIEIVPNWTTVPNSYSRGQRPVDIIFAGRFDKTKNLPLFLDVVAAIKSRYNNLRVVLLGDGPETSTLRSLIAKMHLHETVTVLAPTTDIRKYLLRTKVLLFTSGDTEGMPLIVLEAMAHGCVVVSSRFRGAKEILHHNTTGYVLASPDNMKRTVLRLLMNGQLRSSIAASAHSFVVMHHGTQVRCTEYVKNLI